ncbi:hypothetical protein [Corynebacterium sp. HMSC073D01]|nr:hypothetical protein [Corynebacterium sp. HMSC073D01]OFO48705.1 hypothetical protein HMPREF3044_08390 [Corynebacterium sp. HMSC073D01]
MANRYYRQTGEVLRDQGNGNWSIYNPDLRDWEQTERARIAYETAYQDPYYKISEELALKSIAEIQQRYDQWKEQLKRDNPEGYRRCFPND